MLESLRGIEELRYCTHTCLVRGPIRSNGILAGERVVQVDILVEDTLLLGRVGCIVDERCGDGGEQIFVLCFCPAHGQVENDKVTIAGAETQRVFVTAVGRHGFSKRLEYHADLKSRVRAIGDKWAEEVVCQVAKVEHELLVGLESHRAEDVVLAVGRACSELFSEAGEVGYASRVDICRLDGLKLGQLRWPWLRSSVGIVIGEDISRCNTIDISKDYLGIFRRVHDVTSVLYQVVEGVVLAGGCCGGIDDLTTPEVALLESAEIEASDDSEVVAASLECLEQPREQEGVDF